MLVIDWAEYQCVVDLLSRISSLAEEHGLAKAFILDKHRVLDYHPIPQRMPRILTENLSDFSVPHSKRPSKRASG